MSTTTMSKELLAFCSSLVQSIHSIDISALLRVYYDQLIVALLPHFPVVVIENLQEVVYLTVKWTPHLLKDILSLISTILSPTVIAKQIAFTGLIQTTLLMSHFVRQFLDALKSVIFTKVSEYDCGQFFFLVF